MRDTQVVHSRKRNATKHSLPLRADMFDDSNPPSPSRGSAMSPLIKDAVKDVDWGASQPLPTPTKPDPRESPWLALSQIVPGLFLTCERTTEDRTRLVVLGCRLVIKMNADVDEAPFNIYEYNDDAASHVTHAVDEETFVTRLVAETKTLDADRSMMLEPLFIRSVVADDSPVFDIAVYFEELCSLIELVLSRRKVLEREYAAAMSAGGDIRLPNVVVHCKAGVSRSAAIVIAYLMKRYHISRTHALQYVQDARPIASPNHGFVAQLTLWESTRGHRVTDELSAAHVADNIIRGSTPLQIAGLLTDQLRVLSTSSRLVADRETFGRLVGQLVERKLDVATVVNSLDKVLLDGIHDQAYIDSPTFVTNVVQITTSIKTFAPQVLGTRLWATGEGETCEDREDDEVEASASAPASGAQPLESSGTTNANDTTANGASLTAVYADSAREDPSSATVAVAANVASMWVPDDAIHRRWIQAFCTAATDASEAVEAMCKYVHALGTTQLPAGIAAPAQATFLPQSMPSAVDCSDASFTTHPTAAVTLSGGGSPVGSSFPRGALTVSPTAHPPTSTSTTPVLAQPPTIHDIWYVPPHAQPRPVLVLVSPHAAAATLEASSTPPRGAEAQSSNAPEVRQATELPPASPIDIPWASSLSPPTQSMFAPPALLHAAARHVTAHRIAETVKIVLSFPVLTFFARHAVGFIPWAQLDEAVPASVASPAEARSAVRKLRTLSRRWFLVARWDGAVGAVGMNKLQRWTSCTADPTAPSYLQCLKGDIEVQVYEALEALEDRLNSNPPPTDEASATTAGAHILTLIEEEVVQPTWEEVQVTLQSGEYEHSAQLQATLSRILREKIVWAVLAFVDQQRSELDFVQRTVAIVPHHPGSPNLGGRRSSSVEGGSSLSDSIGAMPPPVQYVRENSTTSRLSSSGSGGELDDVKLLGTKSWQLWLQERRPILEIDIRAMLLKPTTS